MAILCVIARSLFLFVALLFLVLVALPGLGLAALFYFGAMILGDNKPSYYAGDYTDA